MALYICIILELANRTVVAMLAATSAIGVLAALNERLLDVNCEVLLASRVILNVLISRKRI